MSYFEERMADAEFGIRAQLCSVCKNEIKHKFDNAHPDRPTMTCKVIGEIPRALDLAYSYECEHAVIDMEKYKIYKDILPKDFDPAKY